MVSVDWHLDYEKYFAAVSILVTWTYLEKLYFGALVFWNVVVEAISENPWYHFLTQLFPFKAYDDIQETSLLGKWEKRRCLAVAKS